MSAIGRTRWRAHLAVWLSLVVGAKAAPGLNAPPSPPALADIPESQLATTVTPEDQAFGIRLDEVRDDHGDVAEYAYLNAEYHARPTAQKEADFASVLYQGAVMGAPPGMQSQALALALEAARKGNARALITLAWLLSDGTVVARDIPRAWNYARRAANAGDPLGMELLGDFFRVNHGAPAAEYWYEQAADRGWTYGLNLLAKDEETGATNGKPNLALACRHYLYAGLRSDFGSREKLNELAGKGIPEALRANAILTLIRVCREVRFAPKDVTAAIAQLAPRWWDAEAMLTLGKLYDNGFVMGFRDPKKAVEFFTRAAELGSLDARAWRAVHFAEGMGAPKNQAYALKEWHSLEVLDNGEAFASLGYYSFWGSLSDTGLPKNASKCFYYSQRGANAGSGDADFNLGLCYFYGVGTPKDYALAAVYLHRSRYQAVHSYARTRRLVDRCLAFLPP